jgi:hypothetical protein
MLLDRPLTELNDLFGADSGADFRGRALFSPRQARICSLSGRRLSSHLMFIAKNEVISNANHWYAFSQSWR